MIGFAGDAQAFHWLLKKEAEKNDKETISGEGLVK